MSAGKSSTVRVGIVTITKTEFAERAQEYFAEALHQGVDEALPDDVTNIGLDMLRWVSAYVPSAVVPNEQGKGGIDYETARFVLDMSAPEFETVFEVLSKFRAFAQSPVNGDVRLVDMATTIDALQFVIKNSNGEVTEFDG